ncbi:MAG: hypothetical protein ABFS12_18790 [Bacteroidota bacterium]
MAHNNRFLKTSIQHAFEYTLFISILYATFKFFDTNSPDGKEFLSYIIPALFTDIILIVFPFMFVFFYFKDGDAITDIKENILNNSSCQVKEIEIRERLREYHNMMKEGILTQDEFDNIKKQYLKELDKDKHSPHPNKKYKLSKHPLNKAL